MLYAATFLESDCRFTPQLALFQLYRDENWLYIRREDNGIRFALAQHP
jgi:hypothetical protein